MTKPLSIIDKDVSILIVEDEVVLAMALEQSLIQMGFFVSGIESSVQKAISHAKSHRPDIILMDINLNQTQTGIDAANTIWKKFKIPIIYLTSYTNDQTIKDALECEPYGYLIKPCRDEELKVTINMAMHKHKYFFKKRDEIEEKSSDFICLIDNMKFDKANSILYKDENIIKLTKTEKKIFDLLCQKINSYATFEQIFAFIWREDVYDLGKLRTLLYRIRQKTKTNLFENIFEQGYSLRIKNKNETS